MQEKRLYGTFQLNGNIPIHSWYPYLAGYSAHFVMEELNRYNPKKGEIVVDPFAGVATTSLVAKSNGLNSIGIEVNPFVSFVAKTKLNWDFNLKKLEKYAKDFYKKLKKSKIKKYDSNYPKIISEVFSPKILNRLINIKNKINKIQDNNIKNLFRLALVRILKEVSNCKNFAPYFQLKEVKLEDAPVEELFFKTLKDMMEDLRDTPKVKVKSKIYQSDARDMSFIKDDSVAVIITSPPYLNNWDYSYITRIELYFLDYYKSIEEISKNLKTKLIKSSGFVLRNVDRRVKPELNDKRLNNKLLKLQKKLRKASKGRVLKCDLMATAYFNDMHKVLKESYRILKPKGNMSLVIGDSSLYGIHIPTDKILAEIGESLGFKAKIEIIRNRRATRHNKKLVESNVRLFKH